MFVGSNSSSRVYFADSAGTVSPPALFFGVNDMILDFCSQLVDGTTPTTSGKFDFLNFLWFAGPGIVYSNTTGNSTKVLLLINFCSLTGDPSCLKTAILNAEQNACLLCASEYYLYDTACYVTCPEGTVAHEGTKSCQSNSSI